MKAQARLVGGSTFTINSTGEASVGLLLHLFTRKWAPLSGMVGISYVVFAFSSRSVSVWHSNVWHLNWIRLTIQYMASIAFSADNTSHIWCLSIVLTTAYRPALLYYDYLLTFDRERRLFWSWRGFKQWGSPLFFLNRYCGVLGHVPIIIQTFASPESTLQRLCYRMSLYHYILAIIMQTIAGCMLFI